MIDIDALLAERDALKAELDKLRPEMLTALGQCTEEHVWEGHPKMVALRAENERMKACEAIAKQMCNAIFNARQAGGIWDRAKVVLAELQQQYDAALNPADKEPT